MFLVKRRVWVTHFLHLEDNLVLEKHLEQAIAQPHTTVEKPGFQYVHIDKEKHRAERQIALRKILESSTTLWTAFKEITTKLFAAGL